MFQTRPNIVVSQLIKTLDDYGLHIGSETERDITILTKNLAATIVKPNRNIKVLYAVKTPFICNVERESRESTNHAQMYFTRNSF